MAKIFISHSHGDDLLAARLQKLLETTSGRGLQVSRSSQPGAIKTGENWRDWIDDKVLECDVAVVLLTPGSFRAQWVLWEAGAVAGVQAERLRGDKPSSGDPAARRVRVLAFGLTKVNLGPFGASQAADGLDSEKMEAFVEELLTEYKEDIDDQVYRKSLKDLRQKLSKFIPGAMEDLRHSPITRDEGVVQTWLGRLEQKMHKEEYRWITAAQRWINIAFLGVGEADAKEPIDFRLHTMIAEAHGRLKEWSNAADQYELASRLSPNDLVVLRNLGRCRLELKEMDKAQEIMLRMEELDPGIFKADREGVALRCGYFAKLGDWIKVNELLASAEQGMIAADPYLANWRAVAAMKAGTPADTLPLFRQLKKRMIEQGKGFWDQATLVNALLALGEFEDAKRTLDEMNLPDKPEDNIGSATRFYDEILDAFGHKFNWRRAAGLELEASA